MKLLLNTKNFCSDDEEEDAEPEVGGEGKQGVEGGGEEEEAGAATVPSQQRAEETEDDQEKEEELEKKCELEIEEEEWVCTLGGRNVDGTALAGRAGAGPGKRCGTSGAESAGPPPTRITSGRWLTSSSPEWLGRSLQVEDRGMTALYAGLEERRNGAPQPRQKDPEVTTTQ